MSDIKGTPISRQGGYLIRVGWRAAGYSVDQKTEKRYWLMKAVLLLVAIIVGITVARGVESLLFERVSSLVSGHTTLIRNYPSIWQFIIYVLTFVCGGLIYLQLISLIGKRMVRGFDARDDGFGFLAQRRRAANVRKRELIMVPVVLGALWFAPVGLGGALKAFLTLLVAVRLAEILCFGILYPAKK